MAVALLSGAVVSCQGNTEGGLANACLALADCSSYGPCIAHVYDKGDAAKPMTVGIGSALSQTLYQVSVPAHGWASLRGAP